MRPIAIIQARLGSTRLPGKVLRPILGRPILWHIVHRLRCAPGLDGIVVATSELAGDEPIRAFCREEGIACHAGSENDVLDRFYQAALRFAGDPLIRITGDCPFADPALIGRLIDLYKEGAYDHIGVATGAGAIFLDGGRFPDGLDAECFGFAALARAWREATEKSDREHVTPYIWRNKQIFRCGHLKGETDYSHLRWTVDNEADFTLVTQIYTDLYREDRPFLMQDILDYLTRHPQLSELNRDFIGKEGYGLLWDAGTQTGATGKES
ncbi:MAG: glycosyltransferase family protein [Syntrophaceae bacterium]